MELSLAKTKVKGYAIESFQFFPCGGDIMGNKYNKYDIISLKASLY
jgi:hypothetical protein